MELYNNFKNKTGPQEITIIGSLVFKIVRKIGLVLHIFALALGIITILDIAITGLEESSHALEILTLVVVTLIIIEHMLEPIAEKVLLKGALKYFWGTKEVETIISKAEKIDLKAGGYGKITKQENLRQKELISIKWIKTTKFGAKKLAIVSQTPAINKWKHHANEKGNVVAFLIPRYIIIDVKLNKVRLGGKLQFEMFEDEVRREMEYVFDVTNRKATWSGVFPDHPFYGAWKWDENDRSFDDTHEHKHLSMGEKLMGKKK